MPNQPGRNRKKIYLQPLGQFPNGQVPLVESLREYAGAYFAMEVEVLPHLALNDNNITTRINQYTKNRQILTGDVLAILRQNLPADAYCVLAITMDDLYHLKESDSRPLHLCPVCLRKLQYSIGFEIVARR